MNEQNRLTKDRIAGMVHRDPILEMLTVSGHNLDMPSRRTLERLANKEADFLLDGHFYEADAQLQCSDKYVSYKLICRKDGKPIEPRKIYDAVRRLP